MLFGHSRGAGAALNYALHDGDVQAIVLNSGGYAREAGTLAWRAHAPVLMLHGTADSPADGGAEVTDVRMARDFENALRKPVDVMYYDGGRHNGIFTDPRAVSRRGPAYHGISSPLPSAVRGGRVRPAACA